MTVADLVGVEFEDLLLAVAPLDVHREDHLLDFSSDGFLGGQEVLAGKLLGQGAAALAPSLMEDILHQGTQEAAGRDPVMIHEIAVFDGEQRLEEIGRDVGVFHERALLVAVLLEHLPVARVDAGHDEGRGELQAVHFGNVSGDEEARRDARDDSRRQEQEGGPILFPLEGQRHRSW